jgi:hypothetical protein
MAYCEAYAPDMNIQSVSCWASDFKRWLSARGERYPVREERFYDLITPFVEYSTQTGRNNAYFWPTGTGIIGGTYVEFDVRAPADKKEEADILLAWERYHDFRYARDLVHATVIMSNAFVFREQFDAVQYGIAVVLLKLTVLAALMAMCLSFSCGMALAVMLLMIIAAFYIVVIMVRIFEADITVLQVVGLCAFLGYLTTPILRVIQQYAHAFDGPGPRPAYLQQQYETQRGNRRVSALMQTGFMGRSQGQGDQKNEKTEASKLIPMKDEERAQQLLPAVAGLHSNLTLIKEKTPVWIGAIYSERRRRLKTALLRGGEAVVGGMLALALVGLVANYPKGEISAVAEVGLMLFCSACTIVLLVLGLLPVMLLLGFGPSKVKNSSLWEVYAYLRTNGVSGLVEAMLRYYSKLMLQEGLYKHEQTNAQRSVPRMDSMGHSNSTGGSCIWLSKCCTRLQEAAEYAWYLLTEAPGDPTGVSEPDIIVAIRELGFPVHLLLHYASHRAKELGIHAFHTQEYEREFMDAGPQVYTLDLRRATARPPFHVATAQRTCLHMEG